MGCTRVSLRSLGRKKYPLVKNLPKFKFVSNTGFELESLIIDIIDSDTAIATFDAPFLIAPSVVANLVTSSELGNVNVYVESISTTQAIIRTSSPVTGKLHVHVMKIQGCDSPLDLPFPLTLEVLSTLSTQDLFDIVTQDNTFLIYE